MLWGLAVCENNEEGGKTSYRLKFLLQTKFSNKLVYRLQKCKLCVVPTPKSSGLTDLVVSGEWWVGEKLKLVDTAKTGEFTYRIRMKGIMNTHVLFLAHGFASRVPEIFLPREFSGVH